MGGRRDWARFTQILGQYAAVFVAAALGRWRAHLYSVQQLRAAHPEWYREDLTALFGLLRSGAVTPRVARTLPLERAREALQLVSDGQVEGKLVLTMAGPT